MISCPLNSSLQDLLKTLPNEQHHQHVLAYDQHTLGAIFHTAYNMVNTVLDDQLIEQAKGLMKISGRLASSHEKSSEDELMRGLAEYCEKKRLFVCCDGTWKNASGTVAPLTNVAKLARSVYRLGEDDFRLPEGEHKIKKDPPRGAEYDRYGVVRQLVYYSAGVGAQSPLPAETCFAGATGKGLVSNMLSAYCFICNNYNFLANQDEIILVGFSRGAFTVRCLAHFINSIGLLRRKGLVFLRTAYRSWKRNRGDVDANILEALHDLGTHPVRIKVLAEWDTVSAMRVGNKLSFVNTAVPSNVDHAFLALSLHEKRKSFKPLLWEKKASPATRVEQCAFVGCHSDIGGGNHDPGLSTVSFLWMVSQMRNASQAAFDGSTLLQFMTPLEKASWWPGTKPTMGLWNLVSTEGRVEESRKGWWMVPYILSLGRLDGKRDTFLDYCARTERDHREQLQQQAPEQQPFEALLDSLQIWAQHQDEEMQRLLLSQETTEKRRAMLLPEQLADHQRRIDERQQTLDGPMDLDQQLKQRQEQHQQQKMELQQLKQDLRQQQQLLEQVLPRLLRSLPQENGLQRLRHQVEQQQYLLSLHLQQFCLQNDHLALQELLLKPDRDQQEIANIEWQLKQDKRQMELDQADQESTVRLQIHFTVRLLSRRLGSDSRLGCGLFREYRPPESDHVWRKKGHDDLFLTEACINWFERRMLDKWINAARNSWQIGNTATADDDDVRWSQVRDKLDWGAVHNGVPMEKSLVRLIEQGLNLQH